jgi:polysaccharide pyruvyl transferase WcaK-like protein
VKLLIQSASADRGLTSAIEEELGELKHSGRICVVEPKSLSAYQHELSQTGFVVSSRLHTCVLALAQGKQVVGLHYDSHGHKMLGVFDMLQIRPRCLAVSGTQPELTAHSALSLLTQHQESLPGLDERLQVLRSAMREWLYNVVTSAVRVRPDARCLAQLARPFIRCMRSVRV